MAETGSENLKKNKKQMAAKHYGEAASSYEYTSSDMAPFTPQYASVSSPRAPQAVGIATKVRPTDVVLEARPLHDDHMRREEALYNSNNNGAPLTHVVDLPAAGISTRVRDQVPRRSIIAHDERGPMKDALALAHGVSRAQDFPRMTHVAPTGKAGVSRRPADTPLFKPQIDAQPKRRLHTISDEGLQQLHRPDHRREDLAEAMAKNCASSPIAELRRGDAHGINATHGRRRLPEISEIGAAQADRPTGRGHNANQYKSNILFSQDVMIPNHQTGRRRADPSQTKASVF